MKTKSSGAEAGATFMKKTAPELEPDQSHFYNGSAVLKLSIKRFPQEGDRSETLLFTEGQQSTKH